MTGRRIKDKTYAGQKKKNTEKSWLDKERADFFVECES
jgi:hypothetical protein